MKRMRYLLWLALPLAVFLMLPSPNADGKALETTPPAPELKVTEWVKGDPVRLDKDKGDKIYVVEFWATWCPPCRASIPHLTDIQREYKDKGVVVIGISDEDAETVKPFVEKMGDKMNYTVAIDPTRETHKAFNKIDPIPGIPSAYVINKQGNVVWHGHPMGKLEEVLDELTGAAEPADKAPKSEDDTTA